MPGSPNAPDPQAEATRRDGPWTEEEKSRGAGTPGEDTGAAGGASTKARPTDDRARTEGAAARVQRESDDAAAGGAPDGGASAPDPETPVGGGRGTRSMGGSATEPGTDPQAPRNPK